MNLKNESESIETSIKSCACIIDRAVISIDTTDQQNTKAAAQVACEKWGVPVQFLEHTWEDNFSKMRNHTLDAAEAGGGDWIFMIDGHEYIAPGSQHKI